MGVWECGINISKKLSLITQTIGNFLPFLDLIAPTILN